MMTEYHELTTKKYVDAVAEAEIQELKQEKRREENRMLMQFSFAVVVFVMTAVAVYTMPEWLPSVRESLESAGVLRG